MSDNQHSGNWWIWKVFWILLGVTAFEVMLGILKVDGYLPDFLVYDTFLGLAWLTHVFIILTLVKAGYIVMVFMHLGDEQNSSMDNIGSSIYFGSLSFVYYINGSNTRSFSPLKLCL